MEKSISIKKMILLAVTCLCVLLFPLISYASEDSTSADAALSSIEIKGEHIVSNNTALKTGRHTFVLTADDKSYPMPEGSSGGVKEVTISSNEDFSFGHIYFSKPGIYSYTISRTTNESKDLKEDNSVYHVKIAAFNDGTTVIVMQKDGMKEKPDKIVYKDTYVSASNKSAKTGDDAKLLLPCAALFGSALLLIVMFTRRKHDED